MPLFRKKRRAADDDIDPRLIPRALVRDIAPGDDDTTYAHDDSTGDLAATIRVPFVTREARALGYVAASAAIARLVARGIAPRSLSATLSAPALGTPSSSSALSESLVSEMAAGFAAAAIDARASVGELSQVEPDAALADASPASRCFITVTATGTGPSVFTGGPARPQDAFILTKSVGLGVTAHVALRHRDAEAMRRYGRMAGALDIGLLKHAENIRDAEAIDARGLLAALARLCVRNGVGAVVTYSRLPLAEDVEGFVNEGFIPDGARDGWAAAETSVAFDPDVTQTHRCVLCDCALGGGVIALVGSALAGDVRVVAQVVSEKVLRVRT
ncbi:hypothetical protein K8I61_09010 [bacterium]|nr:hypothetical protein [bacterium]